VSLSHVCQRSVVHSVLSEKTKNPVYPHEKEILLLDSLIAIDAAATAHGNGIIVRANFTHVPTNPVPTLVMGHETALKSSNGL